jgi:hypothetical protein
MLTETALARLALHVAKEDDEGLRRYLVHSLPAGGRLEPVHEALAGLSPEFRALALKVAPWLGDDRLGDKGAADRILEVLRSAGREGVPLAGLRIDRGRDRAQALEGLISSGQVVREHRLTGGRPADIYRVAEFAVGVTPADHNDPFAFRPVPID